MLEIGSLVDGKYKILNKVGQGGMSVVYLAMNEKANKQWAVKEVRKDGIKDFEVVKRNEVNICHFVLFREILPKFDVMGLLTRQIPPCLVAAVSTVQSIGLPEQDYCWNV